MSDTELEAALRRWRAEPTRLGAAELARQYQRAGQDLPWDVLLESPTWWSFAETVGKWLAEPLREDLGCTSAELDAAEARLGIALPQGVRELYRLVGRRNDLLDPDLVPLDELTVEAGELTLAQTYGASWCVSTASDPNPSVRCADAVVAETLSAYAWRSFLTHLPESNARRRDEVVEGICTEPLSDPDLSILERSLGVIPLPPIHPNTGPVLFVGEDITILRTGHQTRVAAWIWAWETLERRQLGRWSIARHRPRFPMLDEYRDVDLEFTTTTGGPFLILPRANLSNWWGVCNEVGEPVYLESECDYDRLDPDLSDEFRGTGDLLPLRGNPSDATRTYWALVFEVAGGFATFTRLGSGLVFLRDNGGSDGDILSLLTQLPESHWELDLHQVEVPEDGLALLDAADDGRDPDQETPYGVVYVDLSSGHYSVDRIDWQEGVIEHGPGQAEAVGIQALRFRPLPPTDNQSERATG